MRIERPPYYADIVEDPTAPSPLWHCIVQRYGSPDIISWFQESSKQDARERARQELHRLQASESKAA